MNPSNALDFHTKALVLRAERQRQLASNIANADTPGYQARDFSFSQALGQATGTAVGGSAQLALAPSGPQGVVATAGARHIPLTLGGSASTGGAGATSGYAAQTQPSMDNNTVDLDRERAAFADNAVRYEATLRFINGSSKTLLSAITGQ
ncbi:MAG: flagellar basal body rod protein FlgB [Burkholderiales bacterium]|jgi:flagellar basal-body rod protein FlgB|nr:flagellar basal body rod protein FlgB [Burkholderiales bacterium]